MNLVKWHGDVLCTVKNRILFFMRKQNFLFENTFKEILLSFGSPEFDLQILFVFGIDGSLQCSTNGFNFHIVNLAVMRPIQTVCNTKNGGKFCDNPLIVGRKSAKSFMLDFRMTFSMVPCHVGNDFLLILSETKQI